MQNSGMKHFMSCLAVRNSAVALVTAFYFLANAAFAQQAMTAPAASFVTIGEKPAIVYDSPSQKGNRTLVLSRFHPLEVLVKLDKWTKVRDAEGSIGWVENAAFGERRFVQVVAAVAEVRATSSPASPLVFEAQRGVLLEATGSAVDGWISLKHRDGQAGVVRTSQVWGG
jgi:SH3-like domain-containing protein